MTPLRLTPSPNLESPPMAAPNKLPDKPSELIRVALADLAKVEAMPDVYRVDMSCAWFELGARKCSVCLAGAVMAGTFGAKPGAQDFFPDDFGAENSKLYALDYFRRGWTDRGLAALGIDKAAARNRVVTEYDADPAAFRADMNRLAADLEAEGL